MILDQVGQGERVRVGGPLERHAGTESQDELGQRAGRRRSAPSRPGEDPLDEVGEQLAWSGAWLAA